MARNKKVMCKIYFDWSSGELEKIVYSADWERASRLKKADVLADVIGEFQEDYEKYWAGSVDKIKKDLEEDEKKGGETRQ